MLRYLKSIVTALLVVMAVGYANANGPDPGLNGLNKLEPIHTDHDNKAQLAVPKLHISLKSTPKLTDIPSLKSEFTPQTDFFADNTNSISEGLTQYASLPVPNSVIKTNVESLYEKHGFNKAVENSLYFYTKKFKENFLIQLSRTGKYLEKIAEIFRERELPQELIFLPLIESGFNLHAYSPKKAAGLWQFIPGTAKRYGLKINWWVDERRDPIKATIAASEYLSDLYGMFGSWNLALAAYNAGEGRILKALKKTKTDDFWAIRETKHIKKETKNYVPAYIAATAIALDPESFGFENVAYHAPLEYDEVTINSPMRLKTIAKLIEVEVEDIKELNPELRQSCTPPNVENYTLRIPSGAKEMFLSNLANVKEETISDEQSYTVKKGDSVGKIAKRFGVSSQSIIELNSLGKKARIIAGSKILIPSIITAELSEESKIPATKYKKKLSRKSSRKTSI
ncbi:MAG: transglycosylase SLT domain-containing protein [Thermodesulfovibrionia bacterium]|nr:transglycosylase SLT domain-containing protein [Thermodesulfovibrionia bacterium]